VLTSSLLLPTVCGAVCMLGACAAATKPATSTSPDSPRTASIQRFYDVNGVTAAELLRTMLARGPTVGGLPVYATTEWEVRWHLRSARRAGQCRLENIEVQLQITTVLPRWRPPEAASSQLRQEWSAFLAALDTHERGHHGLGVAAASAVRERLRGLRGLRAESCDALVAEADAAAKNELESFHARNVQYDLDTAHGAKQGGLWPR
jgi:predicted secreted Zn-dependent protease